MADMEVDFQVLTSTHDLKKPENPGILVGTVSSLVTDNYWWYSICPCGQKIEPNENNGFCMFCHTHWSDGLLRYRIKLFVAHAGGCDLFVLHDQDGTHSEIFKMDPKIYLSKLIGIKLVMMVDPEGIEENGGDVAYQVFKSSTDPSLVRLFQLAEKGAVKKKVGASTSGQEMNKKKRLYTLYDEVPRLVKQKLEDAFNICDTAADVAKVNQN
ncbi:hypothetical protein PIB30_016582 [Stylosanthes scabra]|uniref:Replication factor A C-terminal domain-containing protein n=1 Tax=Stylosanthes scabra TaxID=79078 RepID=A0ABU6T770_9FABA|nr:hypothetical protein [Stylosanthes scabra]